MTGLWLCGLSALASVLVQMLALQEGGAAMRRKVKDGWRRCELCGAALSRYNPLAVCAPCRLKRELCDECGEKLRPDPRNPHQLRCSKPGCGYHRQAGEPEYEHTGNYGMPKFAQNDVTPVAVGAR